MISGWRAGECVRDVVAGAFTKASRNSRFCWGDEFLRKISGKPIVEFGCGEGVEAVEMAQKGAKRVIGINIREDVLQTARHKALTADVQNTCLVRIELVNPDLYKPLPFEKKRHGMFMQANPASTSGIFCCSRRCAICSCIGATVANRARETETAVATRLWLKPARKVYRWTAISTAVRSASAIDLDLYLIEPCWCFGLGDRRCLLKLGGAKLLRHSLEIA